MQGVDGQWSKNDPDSKVHGANMGSTWVLSAPDGPHVGPMNLAIGEEIGTAMLSLVVSFIWSRVGYLVADKMLPCITGC